MKNGQGLRTVRPGQDRKNVRAEKRGACAGITEGKGARVTRSDGARRPIFVLIERAVWTSLPRTGVRLQEKRPRGVLTH